MSSELNYMFIVQRPRHEDEISITQLFKIDNWCSDNLGKINGRWTLGGESEWRFLNDEDRSFFLLHWGELLK